MKPWLPAVLATCLFAPPAAAKGTLKLEPPILEELCSGSDACFSLRLEKRNWVKLGDFGRGVREVLIADSTSETRKLTEKAYGPAREVVYALVLVEVRADAPLPLAEGLTWQQDGPVATASFGLQFYRGDRGPLKQWLSVVGKRNAARRESCPEDEVAWPVRAEAVDLDGDGAPEGLTTVGSSVGADWFCRWTDIHRIGGSFESYGTPRYGYPSTTVRQLRGPGGKSVAAVVTAHECCDLDQTFLVARLKAGSLETLFANSAAPIDGKRVDGFAMFKRFPDGVDGIAFTPQQERYNYGNPLGFAGFTFFRFNGRGFEPSPAP